MAASRSNAAKKATGKPVATKPKATASIVKLAEPSFSSSSDDETLTPLAITDALCRTAIETCHQRDRRARLSDKGAAKWEIIAAEALVDTCDLALEESVREFERRCGKEPVSDAQDVRQATSALWLAAREYIRRLSIANRAMRQLSQQHGAEQFGDLHLEYELEASALLALKQASQTYAKLRPDAK